MGSAGDQPLPSVRPATGADAPAIAAIDAATWSPANSPGPAPDPHADPLAFGPKAPPSTVLVAARDGHVLGWIRLQPAYHGALAGAHVLLINGLAVDPTAQRQGIARALIDAAIAHARSEGIRKLNLRVLATNPAAQALYDSAGFVTEGILRGEFKVEGEYIDDVLMALTLEASAAGDQSPSSSSST